MLVLDASALVKRYVEEAGTSEVIRLMAEDSKWCAAALCRTETQVTLCHLGLGETVERQLGRLLHADWEHFLVVPVDDLCLASAAEIGCERRLRTLDAIHLAAADRLPRPFTFVTFDVRQADAARALAFEVTGVQ
ncbi:MAG: type II toxin-antitoxin system VapC family toxin [Actinobacteria bacterium]|nr:type II toxin-antitoxin system VapC family toxin [Actinomycetota bacterium]